MDVKTVLVLIPARFASSRFPGKPLAEISGKSMIQRVYENCQQSGFTISVVTDDQRIENHVKGFSGMVCRVDDDVPSGTERIQLAHDRFFGNQGFELVINVQGDEPLLTGNELKRLAEFHLKTEYDIVTIVKEFPQTDCGFSDPNRVKVVFSQETGKCHYFSRARIPFGERSDSKCNCNWFQHIGVYSYRVSALKRFCGLQTSYYEAIEKLEQLRALESGMEIGAMVTKEELIGVDIPSDIKKVEGVISGKGN